jgi:PAS domain S-box-containing protein
VILGAMKLRSYLILLVLAAALPVVLFAGIMSYRSYQQHRESLAQTMIERARAISAALDREFLVSIQSLKVLGASTRLDKGQLGDFYSDMKGALAGYSRAWQNLTLTDAAGQQLLNLRRPFGAKLPATGNPDAIAHVRRTKEPVIANLSSGPVSSVAAVVVHVPILRGGQVAYMINAIFYPAPLTDLLLQQKLPADWIATIVDRNHIIVARTRDAEKFFGKPLPPAFTTRIKQKQESAERSRSLDDVPVIAAHHRSDFSGWTVALAIPTAHVDASLNQSLLLTGAGALALLLAALLLAILLGRRIATPVEELAQAANLLGRGEIPDTASSPVLEVDRVAQAMAAAGRKRKEHEARIRDLNRVYAVLSDINQAIVRLRDPQTLLSEACRIAVEQGEFKGAWIGRLHQPSGRIEVLAQSGFRAGDIEQLTAVPYDSGHNATPMASALHDGQHQVCNDLESASHAAAWGNGALRRGHRSAAAFPLKIGNQVVAVFNLYSSERDFFDAEEVRLLDELAADISLALEIHRNEADKLDAEKSLRISEERHRLVSLATNDVIWDWDLASNTLRWNENVQTLFGYSQAEVGGDITWRHEKIHPEDRAGVISSTHSVIQGKEQLWSAEYRFARRDGAYAYVVDRGFVMRDDQDRAFRMVGSIRDTTERKRTETALREARDQLEQRVAKRTEELERANVQLRELDQMKSQFLANMSHELRTPMNAIIGFTELLHDGKVGGPVSAQQKEYLGDILNSASHLLQLINDVLDLSKVEAGRMEVFMSTFPIEDLIIEVVHNVAPIMTTKGLKLRRDIPPGLAPITTDKRKLLQILLNLASNAVKFTDRGEIGISCDVAEGKMRISVSDTGTGIRAKDMALLFQPFSQLDNSLRKRHEGTGLGLNLSKRLAVLLGGDVTVVSEEGKGSIFTIEIPYPQ